MENSFHQMMKAFPIANALQLEQFTTSYHSTGILNRVLAILEAKKNQGDINHIIGDIHFLTLGLSPSKTVLTIHDCGFLQYYTNPIQQWILKLFWLTIPIKRSRIVTVVSQATKEDVLKYTCCPEEKIRIVPTIIGDYFNRIDKKFNTSKPTVLHLGVAFNKNLERHIAALEGITCHFRIIGKLSEKHKILLEKHKIEYSAVANITKEQIQEEYAQADLVLFASTLEGFGMPILEAQTVGRPVITSSISSMPEVAGNSACLVCPLSIESIRVGILKVIQDETYRNSLIQKGFDNIKRFQPEIVAKQYEGVYQEIHTV